jgi:hypothetical protein
MVLIQFLLDYDYYWLWRLFSFNSLYLPPYWDSIMQLSYIFLTEFLSFQLVEKVYRVGGKGMPGGWKRCAGWVEKVCRMGGKGMPDGWKWCAEVVEMEISLEKEAN